jgi:hypothetical protein
MVVESVLSKAKPALAKIVAEDVRPMSQSFSATIGEAERVDRLWEKYGAQLKAVKPDVPLASSISLRIEVLKEAQFAVYERVRPVKSSEEKTLVADAEALRAEFLDIFTWAFRDGSHDADLKRIREGDGVADLVADLGDLVELADKESERLGFQKNHQELSKQAAQLATKLKEAFLGRLTTKTDTAATDLRDRAATWLDTAVKEVRAAGRFAFRRDPDLAALFSLPSRRTTKRPTAATPSN